MNSPECIESAIKDAIDMAGDRRVMIRKERIKSDIYEGGELCREGTSYTIIKVFVDLPNVDRIDIEDKVYMKHLNGTSNHIIVHGVPDIDSFNRIWDSS